MRHSRTIPVPTELFEVYLRELKPGELKVLLVLICWRQVKEKPSSFSRAIHDLRRDTGLSIKTIKKALKGLHGLGLGKIYSVNSGNTLE